jgi:hypothetical protein
MIKMTDYLKETGKTICQPALLYVCGHTNIWTVSSHCLISHLPFKSVPPAPRPPAPRPPPPQSAADLPFVVSRTPRGWNPPDKQKNHQVDHHLGSKPKSRSLITLLAGDEDFHLYSILTRHINCMKFKTNYCTVYVTFERR